MNRFSDYHIVLASASPRRQELLKNLGLDFEIRLKEVDENYPNNLDYREIALYLANLKAEEHKKDLKDNELLITADTVVALENRILGKPKDRVDAIEMLKFLSGKKHEVISGVTLTSKQKQVGFSSFTNVFFKTLCDKEIIYYVDNYKPYDKAGAYGIQEWIGYIGIERIEGSFYNVMGLPIQRIYETLRVF